MDNLGWQQTLTLCALMGIVVVCVYCYFIQSPPPSDGQNVHQIKVDFTGVRFLLNHKKVWLLAIYSGIAWSPMAVFSGLWGDGFIMTAFQYSKLEAASLVSISFIGLAVGGPFFGWVAWALERSL